MADIKLQAFKDDREVPGEIDWDQRASKGEFRGAAEGMHVKTLGEFRVDDDVEEALTNPDRLSEFIKPGDCVMDVVTRALAGFKPGDSLPGEVGAALPWNRLLPIVYDND
jgi:hypothetical protein